MPGVQSDEIQIRGVQKTNIGPVMQSEDIEIFEGGIVGGSVSDEFEDAMRFHESLESTKRDE